MELQDLIDKLLSGWVERVTWASRVTDCSESCHRRALGMTIGELRHYECDCPARIEYQHTEVMQVPLLTQLFEAKWAVPVSGNGGGGNPNKSESQMPGNLLRPADLLGKLHVAASTALNDCGISNDEYNLERCLQILRVAEFGEEEQRRDAAHLLAVPVRESLIELGYISRRVLLADSVCPDCGGNLSVARSLPEDVRCEGTGSTQPCGRLWRPEEWLERFHAARDADGAALALRAPRRGHVDVRLTCKAGHPRAKFGRVGNDGRTHCRECDRLRKAARAVRAAYVYGDDREGRPYLPEGHEETSGER